MSKFTLSANRLLKGLALAAGLMTTSLANAGVMTFNFYQGGFDEGAFVTGSFSGIDLDGDGQLASFSGEMTNFSMSFSGNTLVGAFSLGAPDLWGFVYDLNGGPLGDGLVLGVEGIGTSDGVFSYEAGPGPVALCGVGAPCAFVQSPTGAQSWSNELIAVTATGVPLPASLPLFGIALLAMGYARRRLHR